MSARGPGNGTCQVLAPFSTDLRAVCADGRFGMLQISTSPTTTTVLVAGDLDLSARAAFEDVATQVRALRREHLVVDMCDVGFIDSTGTSFLMALADAGRSLGATVVLRGLSERDRFVLEICGALPMFRLDAEHRCDDAPRPRAPHAAV